MLINALELEAGCRRCPPGWMGTQGPRTGLDGRGAENSRTILPWNGKPTKPPRSWSWISDLQEGAKLDGLQGHEWPKGVQVIIERVEAKPQSNAGLEIQNPVNDDSPVYVRAR